MGEQLQIPAVILDNKLLWKKHMIKPRRKQPLSWQHVGEWWATHWDSTPGVWKWKLKYEKIVEQDRRIAEMEVRQEQPQVQNNQSVQSGPGKLPLKTILPTYDGSKPREYYVWDQNISGMLSFYKGMSEKQRKFQLYTNIKEIAAEKVQDLGVGTPEFELRGALF